LPFRLFQAPGNDYHVKCHHRYNTGYDQVFHFCSPHFFVEEKSGDAAGLCGLRSRQSGHGSSARLHRHSSSFSAELRQSFTVIGIWRAPGAGGVTCLPAIQHSAKYSSILKSSSFLINVPFSGYGGDVNRALRRLRFSVQKLFKPKTTAFSPKARFDEKLARDGKQRHLSGGLVRHDDDAAARNSVHPGRPAKRESCRAGGNLESAKVY
jgi:hypothetical protein